MSTASQSPPLPRSVIRSLTVGGDAERRGFEVSAYDQLPQGSNARWMEHDVLGDPEEFEAMMAQARANPVSRRSMRNTWPWLAELVPPRCSHSRVHREHSCRTAAAARVGARAE